MKNFKNYYKLIIALIIIVAVLFFFWKEIVIIALSFLAAGFIASYIIVLDNEANRNTIRHLKDTIKTYVSVIDNRASTITQLQNQNKILSAAARKHCDELESQKKMLEKTQLILDDIQKSLKIPQSKASEKLGEVSNG